MAKKKKKVEWTAIRISKDLREILRQIGHKDQTYQKILENLVLVYQNCPEELRGIPSAKAAR
jgi:hypothetical protein